MEFRITITHERRTLRLTMIRIAIDAHKEQYKVIARNRILLLETNWPFFHTRGLIYRRPDWKLVDGSITYAPVYQAIVEAVEAHVRAEIKKARG